MLPYDGVPQETVRPGQRRQDRLNPQKYRYVKAFDDLADDNTHIVAIVWFRFSEGEDGRPVVNNREVRARRWPCSPPPRLDAH